MSAAASTFYPTQQQQAPQKHTTATVHVQSKGVNLPTAIATVAGQGNISDCRLLFDTGSTRTFIHESLAASVNKAVVGEDVLSIASLNLRPSDRSPCREWSFPSYVEMDQPCP